MARMIDADAMLAELKPITYEMEHTSVLISDMSKIMRKWVERQPTLTQPNEPLTCDGCIHEHNEHENCYYCQRASYLGDYYYRRPPEGEEEENDVIEITENL